MHKRLFIPGPVEVREEIRKELSRPMIGHRGKDFQELFRETTGKLKRLLYTENPVFISTSSGTGLWEAGIRNCVRERALFLVNGAFSEKWYHIASACGKEADAIEMEWGKAVKPEMVEKKLNEKEYDTLCMVHNETSTGVENPLEGISEALKKNPDVCFIVDTVSSLAGVKIDVDRLGIDVCLASVQKAIGLPPGLSICSVSQKAMERSRDMKNKGYYFDFMVFMKYYNKNQTITTPSIPHIFALNRQLDEIFNEGPERRFERHEEMARITQKWALENGFELFAEKGYESKTVTCIKNNKGLSVERLNSLLGERGYAISNGYGEIKEKTFRIAHMGDTSIGEVTGLLSLIGGIIENEDLNC